MINRRCVICGREPSEFDILGKSNYHYPKNKQEARIWQRSMGANSVCVESIQRQCCVCIEHIPEFVERAHRQCEKAMAVEETEAECREELDEAEDTNMNRPSVNVLLLSGATLPSYCGRAKTNCEVGEGYGSDDAELKPEGEATNGSESDTDIRVLESSFKDNGATFPDIDETEVTVLRTPMQEDDELEILQDQLEEETECQGRRDACFPGCTDVLLLGRGRHPTDECPCQCEQCTKPAVALEEEEGEVCCNPPCCPEPAPPQYFDQPPCGCECEQQVRRELGRVIKKQKNRIRELEELVCRQNNLHLCLQQKVDELYCEFGRVDPEDQTRLMCCATGRDPPNCAVVLKPAVEEVIEAKPEIPETPRKIFRRKRTTAVESSGNEFIEPVHWYSEKNPDTETTKCTHLPPWVMLAESTENAKRNNVRRLRRKEQISKIEKPEADGVPENAREGQGNIGNNV